MNVCYQHMLLTPCQLAVNTSFYRTLQQPLIHPLAHPLTNPLTHPLTPPINPGSVPLHMRTKVLEKDIRGVVASILQLLGVFEAKSVLDIDAHNSSILTGEE